MSSQVPNAEQTQQQQVNPTSAIASEPKEVKMDVKPAVPLVSYAQAAKSKAPSVPSTPSASMAKSDANEVTSKKETELHSTVPGQESKNDAPKRATSEGAKPRGNEFKSSNEPTVGSRLAADGAVKEMASGVQTRPAASANPNASNSPSPDFGETSLSTLPKDEDRESAAIDSSDSTWDKQSQSSQIENKHDGKTNAEKDIVQKEPESTWDEPKPEPASLKEAPPPPVNFWAQRMAQNPKPKLQPNAPSQALKPAVVTNGAVAAGEPTKPAESSGEPKKQENRKRSKGNLDDRSINKESGSKSIEGKAKTGEGSNKANPGTMAPPPPPGDAISWPTPDTALEEKKKSQSRMEKEEKEKTPTTKPHGKKEWQTVPFVPTVNFNTPMPTPRSRGGRGAGGTTRENGGRGRNSNGVDKATSTSANLDGQSPTTSDERGKPGPGSSNVGAPVTQKSKRASSAGPTIPKEQRRPGEAYNGDRRKDSDFNSARGNQSKGGGGNEPRRQSATRYNDNQAGKGFSGRPPRESFNAPKRSQTFDDGKNPQDASSTAQTAPRTAETEKREGYAKPQDNTKDTQGGTIPRERGEGRPERGGRGGYRGRGGSNFNAYNAHLPNGQNGQGFSGPPPQYQQPMTGLPSRSFSNHERLASQAQGGPYHPTNQPPTRSYRSNSRSHSIQHSYGRLSHQPHGGTSHLPNLQTDLANTYGYQYEPQPGSMSALPYNPYAPVPNLLGMVATQMEYYFSVDNLCKDRYLRSKMNSHGWVPLELVAGFNRIKQLTPDIGVVRYVCFNSSVIEARVAEDDSVWLRKRVDWQQFVLDMDSRDPEARNDGPQFQPLNPFGASQPYQDSQEMSPRSAAASAPLDNIQYQSLDGAAAPLHQVVMAPSQQHNGMNPGSQVPLSAAVSEFSPSVRSASGRVFSSPDSHAHGTSIISNEEMDKLNITFQTKPADPSAPAPPFHSASTRTLSNGSLDGTSVGSELPKFTERQSRPLLNGEHPDSDDRSIVNRSRSPFSVGSPGRYIATSSPPVFWSKHKEHSSRVHALTQDCSSASYPFFRQSALSQRERVTDICVYDMQVLYSFWAHFLPRNFNLDAYEEFHRVAVEDEASRQSTFGMKSLIQYYDEALLGQRTIPNENIANDFIQIVRRETPKGDGPIFKRLRAAWRNGAWNAKNRSKISKLIDTDLTTELDK